MSEPFEELYLARQEQRQRDCGSIERNIREGAGQIKDLDNLVEWDAHEKDVVQVIKHAVPADNAKPLDVADDVEEEQRHRDGAGKDGDLLGDASQPVVVGAVHHLAALGEEPVDDSQQNDRYGSMKPVVVPPTPVEHALTIEVAQQEERVETERALYRQQVAQPGEAYQHRDEQGEGEIYYGPVTQPLGRVVQHDAPIDDAEKVPEHAKRERHGCTDVVAPVDHDP